MAIVAYRFSERPELWDRIAGLSEEVWPEYNLHGDVLNRYWVHLYDLFAEYQFVLYDPDADEVLAEGHSIPVAWGGELADLGPGIDASIAAGFALHAEGGSASALCALAAEIPPRHRERRLASVILEQMRALASSAGLRSLIAPVRPNWKQRYPLTPIERYVTWVRPDGSPFDPWIRVHVRLGGRIGPALPHSMRITGSVADWEAWTGMAFPESGRYVFPACLTTVDIGRDGDVGSYWEPNVWIVHYLDRT
ncbi:MAG: hypothetical protein JOZ09_06730 [Pseudonocardiales bacterium]|nr:hypothetical protein [Pseudonocardiales bacterium]